MLSLLSLFKYDKINVYKSKCTLCHRNKRTENHHHYSLSLLTNLKLNKTKRFSPLSVLLLIIEMHKQMTDGLCSWFCCRKLIYHLLAIARLLTLMLTCSAQWKQHGVLSIWFRHILFPKDKLDWSSKKSYYDALTTYVQENVKNKPNQTSHIHTLYHPLPLTPTPFDTKLNTLPKAYE